MRRVALILFALTAISGLSLGAGNFPQPSICSRSCWNARAPQGTIYAMSGLNRAVIHHTAAAGDYSVSSIDESKAKVRAIQNYCLDALGYSDIMYHFMVDKLGNRFEGRYGSISGWPKGAHDGTNYNSFGFTLLGYYHTPYNQTPTSVSRQALYDLIAWKIPDPFTGYGSGTYNNKTVGYVCGHREVKATACPGDLMYAYIGANYYGGEARNEINARIVPQEVIVDNDTANFSASANWWTSTYTAGYYGANYHCRATAEVSDMAAWNVNLPSSGSWKVYARWTAGANRPSNACYHITHDGGTSYVYVNQQESNGTWVLLGTFNFPSGASQKIKLSCWNASGYVVIADAVKFVK